MRERRKVIFDVGRCGIKLRSCGNYTQARRRNELKYRFHDARDPLAMCYLWQIGLYYL